MRYTLRRMIQRLLKKGGKTAYIITHKYADIDALASALALNEYIKTRFPEYKEIVLFFPEGVSREAKDAYYKITGQHLVKQQTATDFLREDNAIYIILDTASIEQLPGLEKLVLEKSNNILLIDHHKDNSLKKQVKLSYIDSTSTSTSEIISGLLTKKEIKKEIACLLTVGIIIDSSRFSRASFKTFKELAKLTRICPYEEALRSIFRGKEDYPVRLAKLKALQRMILVEKNSIIISITYIGSYESEVAAALLKNGADIAIVLSPKKDETRVIIRTKQGVPPLYREKIIRYLIKEFKAKGGGHLEASVYIIKKKIGKRELPKMCKEISLAIEKTLPA